MNCNISMPALVLRCSTSFCGEDHLESDLRAYAATKYKKAQALRLMYTAVGYTVGSVAKSVVPSNNVVAQWGGKCAAVMMAGVMHTSYFNTDQMANGIALRP